MIKYIILIIAILFYVVLVFALMKAASKDSDEVHETIMKHLNK
jgi:hypothetical protein